MPLDLFLAAMFVVSGLFLLLRAALYRARGTLGADRAVAIHDGSTAARKPRPVLGECLKRMGG